MFPFSLVILNNSDEEINTLTKLHNYCLAKNITAIAPASGSIMNSDKTKRLIVSWIDIIDSGLKVRGQYIGDNNFLQEYTIVISEFGSYTVNDRVNLLN